MNLEGHAIKIKVSEPGNWKEELYGKVLSLVNDQKLLIQLTQPLTGKKMVSDLVELVPTSEKTGFKKLSLEQAVHVGGGLVTEKSDNFDYILIGEVILNQTL